MRDEGLEGLAGIRRQGEVAVGDRRGFDMPASRPWSSRRASSRLNDPGRIPQMRRAGRGELVTGLPLETSHLLQAGNGGGRGQLRGGTTGEELGERRKGGEGESKETRTRSREGRGGRGYLPVDCALLDQRGEGKEELCVLAAACRGCVDRVSGAGEMRQRGVG